MLYIWGMSEFLVIALCCFSFSAGASVVIYAERRRNKNKSERTIYFKNGSSVGITQNTFNTISNQLVTGAKQFQIFTDKDFTWLIINITEITHIE